MILLHTSTLILPLIFYPQISLFPILYLRLSVVSILFPVHNTSLSHLKRYHLSIFVWVGLQGSLGSPTYFSDCLGRRVFIYKLYRNICLHYKTRQCSITWGSRRRSFIRNISFENPVLCPSTSIEVSKNGSDYY